MRSSRTSASFLQQRYASVSTSYEQARQNALKQQLYIVRVGEPQHAGQVDLPAAVPERADDPGESCSIVYAIGWLLVTGVREHAN